MNWILLSPFFSSGIKTIRYEMSVTEWIDREKARTYRLNHITRKINDD
jgi:hypothetical protein